MKSNNIWITPIHIDAEINSAFDDFGLITENDMLTGYFSSNRIGSEDIYRFSRRLIQFTNCVEQKENKFCYKFFDERNATFDTNKVVYEWSFSDGIQIEGEQVKHCFPGPGEYSVMLVVYNPISSDTLNLPAPFIVNLENKIQGFIQSENEVYVGDLIIFDGQQSNLPFLNIKKYYWNFGNGYAHTGPRINYSYSKSGQYIVKLGLEAYTEDSTLVKQCVYKNIIVKERE